MTDTIRIGESGKIHRINTQFDMSNNTSITFDYTKPSGAVLNATATLGTTTEIIDGVSVAPNFWAFYAFEVGEIDEAGDYDVTVTYNNTGTSPVTVLLNLDPVILVVGD